MPARRRNRTGAKGDSRLPRYYAVVETAQGDLAELLISNGLARIHGYKIDHPKGMSSDVYHQRLQRLEDTALKQKLGAWNPELQSKSGPPKPKKAKPAAGATPVEIPAF